MTETPMTKPDLQKMLRDLAVGDLADNASIHDHPAAIAANVLEDVQIPFLGEDDVLGHLREARALLEIERDECGKPSRELSVALTEIDTAILWRHRDLQLKQPIVNECAEAP